MKKLNQKGIAHVGIVLIVVLIGIVGFTGWKVYDSSRATKKSLNDASKSDTAVTEKKENTADKSSVQKTTDPTADWTAYSNKEGKFSLKYPKSWVTAKNPELCSPGLVLLGQSATTVGKCASDSGGEVAVSSVEGDKTSDYKVISDYYSDVASQTATVNGVTGTKQTGTAKAGEGIGPVAGTKLTRYMFVTNNRTYVADYNQSPGLASVLDDFNLLVTKTLKFE